MNVLASVGDPPTAKWNRKRKQHEDNGILGIRGINKALNDPRSDALIVASRLYPPPSPLTACSLSIEMAHAAHCVMGKYNKYSRQLPQTEWIIGGGRHHSVALNGSCVITQLP